MVSVACSSLSATGTEMQQLCYSHPAHSGKSLPSVERHCTDLFILDCKVTFLDATPHPCVQTNMKDCQGSSPSGKQLPCKELCVLWQVTAALHTTPICSASPSSSLQMLLPFKGVDFDHCFLPGDLQSCTTSLQPRAQ